MNSVFEFLFVEKLENQKDEFSAERRHSLVVFSVPLLLRTHATNTSHSTHKDEKLGFPNIQNPIVANMSSKNTRKSKSESKLKLRGESPGGEIERKVVYLC